MPPPLRKMFKRFITVRPEPEHLGFNMIREARHTTARGRLRWNVVASDQALRAYCPSKQRIVQVDCYCGLLIAESQSAIRNHQSAIPN